MSRTSSGALPRMIASVTGVPVLPRMAASANAADRPAKDCPSTPVITSPAASPPRAAGDPREHALDAQSPAARHHVYADAREGSARALAEADCTRAGVW